MRIFMVALCSLFYFSNVSVAQNPQIVSVTPSQNALNISPNTDISVTFDLDMDEVTITNSSFTVNSNLTGLHTGVITYDGPSRTATLDPSADFEEGEIVTATLTTEIRSSGGIPLASHFTWSFTIDVNDGTGVFTFISDYGIGDIGDLSVADLDGDGNMDIIATIASSDNVAVLIGNGDGTFIYPPAFYDLFYDSDYPVNVIAADLDSDNYMDLVAVNLGSNNLAVLINNGDGTFPPPSIVDVGTAPEDVVAADLNGDGFLDLASANRHSDDISVLIGNGDGTFSTQMVYITDDSPKSIIAYDLDGDGDLDLGTANLFSDNISILLNNGNGTFAAQTTYSVGIQPNSIAGTDFDGDGDVDLIVPNKISNHVSILMNNGNGTYANHVTYPVDAEPTSVCAGDFDSDGHIDIAIANYFSENVSVLINNGDGTFGAHVVYDNDGNIAEFIKAVDLNNDGSLDLAVSGAPFISILLNEPNPAPVPTLSEWGMIILALLLLALGTVAVVRRRRTAVGRAA